MSKAQELRDKIARLERELQSAKDSLHNIELCCTHIWGEVTYDPIRYEGYSVPNSMPHDGSYVPYDEIPFRQGYSIPSKTEDRWKRVCKTCGKVDYTKQFDEHKQVTKTPRF